MTHRYVALVAAAALLLPSPILAETLYVPTDYPTIQAGIDAAQPGDVVLIADGIYSGEGNRDLDFLGKAITVRSENGPWRCIIDCFEARGEHHRGFDFHSGEGQDSVLQGLAIRRGQIGGGGILCRNASPSLVENLIVDNEPGGGIWCWNSSPQILRNAIVGNHYFAAVGGAAGGGISCESGSSPLIEGNFIAWNLAAGESASAGGGIYVSQGAPTIRGNTIKANQTDIGGGVCAFFSGSGGVIERNWIEGNQASWLGGGISCESAGTITGNVIIGNVAMVGGGVEASSAIVSHNIICDNRASSWNGGWGGGISCSSSTAADNLLRGNEADYGGGLSCSSTIVADCTIVENVAEEGGGIRLGEADGLIRDTILWQNTAPVGKEVYVWDSVESTELDIRYSDIQGGQSSVYVEPGASLTWGPGMIDADPLLVSGPAGDEYLSQLAAGQAAQSPCVDAGSATAEELGLHLRTTRTDLVIDQGLVDLGFHNEVAGPDPDTFITDGPGWSSDDSVILFSFTGRDDRDPPADLTYACRLDGGDWSAYSSRTQAVIIVPSDGYHRFEVRARDAEGQVDPTPAFQPFLADAWVPGENWGLVVTGPGPGPINPPLVRTPQAQWLAYSACGQGVNVACGNLDGEGADEVVTGPGPGPAFGPHVRGWSLDGTPLAGVSFLAYGTYRWGANVACGDVDGDGFDEIVTGAGPGAVFGPHVRGWNVDGGTATAIPGISFLAYGTHKYGVNVACGDLDGDGVEEIVSGAGPGAVFGPHVRGWRYDGAAATAPIPGLSFLAYGTRRWGVNVACGDLDGDGRDEVVTGPGPGTQCGSNVRAWSFTGGTVLPLEGVSFLAYPGWSSGVVVACGDLDQDGREEILTMPGPGLLYPAEAKAWRVVPGGVEPVTEGFPLLAYDDWMRYGGRISGVRLANRPKSVAGGTAD